ncbi:MAG: response regulator [Candidatus Omnitrophota bacterium]
MDNKTKVLIVDDDHDVLELLKDLFTKKGYEVECVNSGLEALDFTDKASVDAILLDIKMPELDGIETLGRLKKKKPELPVVILTAYGYDDNFINKALELGAAGYISKNLPLNQIVYAFQTLLAAEQKKREG